MPQKPKAKAEKLRRLPIRVIVTRGGGPAELGRRLGISGSAVSQWRQVPEKHALQVAAITGIPLVCIRPDLFAVDKVLKATRDLNAHLIQKAFG